MKTRWHLYRNLQHMSISELLSQEDVNTGRVGRPASRTDVNAPAAIDRLERRHSTTLSPTVDSQVGMQ